MSKKDEALKLSLEDVYETIIQWDEGGGKRSRRELARRIVALAEQPAQQEPVGWMCEDYDKHGTLQSKCIAMNQQRADPDNPLRVVKPLVFANSSPQAQRKPLTDEQQIKVRRELFRFHSEQDWINKAQRRYAKCGVPKGYYITIDAAGHVMHMGKCFKNAAYPVTCYELQTNWRDESAAHGIKGDA